MKRRCKSKSCLHVLHVIIIWLCPKCIFLLEYAIDYTSQSACFMCQLFKISLRLDCGYGVVNCQYFFHICNRCVHWLKRINRVHFVAQLDGSNNFVKVNRVWLFWSWDKTDSIMVWSCRRKRNSHFWNVPFEKSVSRISLCNYHVNHSDIIYQIKT